MRRKRDLDRTMERLLRAALAEFSAHGLVGARTEVIAARARVDKRMLFYCFGSKQELYREVMRRKLMERAELAQALPDDMATTMLEAYRVACSDHAWVRMLQWEALAGNRPMVSEKDRGEFVRKTLTRFERFRKDGVIPADADPAQLFISMVALAMFPLAFPQIAWLACGTSPRDPRFMRKRREFLAWLGDRIQGAGRKRRRARSEPGGTKIKGEASATGSR